MVKKGIHKWPPSEIAIYPNTASRYHEVSKNGPKKGPKKVVWGAKNPDFGPFLATFWALFGTGLMGNWGRFGPKRGPKKMVKNRDFGVGVPQKVTFRPKMSLFGSGFFSFVQKWPIFGHFWKKSPLSLPRKYSDFSWKKWVRGWPTPDLEHRGRTRVFHFFGFF